MSDAITYSDYLGKRVIYRTVTQRLRGLVRMPTQDRDYLVVTPEGSAKSDVIHLSDVISIIA